MSATDAPPPYSQLFDEVEGLIKSLPNASKEKVYETMNAEMKKTETTTKLVAEVKKLADGGSEVGRLFDSVALKLAKADSKKYKGVEELLPGWKALRTRFDNLFAQSKMAATDTNSYIKRYISFMVPMIMDQTDTKFTEDEKKAELTAYIKKGEKASMKEAQTTAMEFAQQFKKLSQDVEEYAVKFENYAKTQQDAWDKKVTDLGREIRDLNGKLEEYKAEVLKWSIALGLTVGGAAIAAGGVLLAMGPLGPFVAAGILIAGLIAGGIEAKKLADAVKNRDSTQDEIDDKQKELDDIKKKLAELKEIQGELKKAQTEASSICSRLGGFEKVWLGVSNDAGILMGFVQGGLEAATYKGLREQIGLSVAGYTALSEALTYYSTIN